MALRSVTITFDEDMPRWAPIRPTEREASVALIAMGSDVSAHADVELPGGLMAEATLPGLTQRAGVPGRHRRPRGRARRRAPAAPGLAALG